MKINKLKLVSILGMAILAYSPLLFAENIEIYKSYPINFVLATSTVNKDNPAIGHIKSMQDDNSLANVLDILITDGTFCYLRGHKWGSHLHLTLEYASNRVDCRKCQICGLHQSRSLSDWK